MLLGREYKFTDLEGGQHVGRPYSYTPVIHFVPALAYEWLKTVSTGTKEYNHDDEVLVKENDVTWGIRASDLQLIG